MSPNGSGSAADTIDAELGGVGAQDFDPRELGRAYARAKVDSGVANVALMMLHATERLNPLLQSLSRLSLRWATLACGAGLATYAITHPSWERAAIAGGFMILSPLIWWRN